jgi:hypothetical protein
MDAELNMAIRSDPPINTIIDLLEIFFKLNFPESKTVIISKDTFHVDTNFRHTKKVYKVEGDDLNVFRLNANKDIFKISKECSPLAFATKSLYIRILESLYGSGT